MKPSDDEKSVFILESGRKLYAHAQILGIGFEWLPDNPRQLTVFEGYDGDLGLEKFTTDERREIAEYAIDLWNKWSKEQK